VDTLNEILKRTMMGYTGRALNGHSYLTANDDKTLFTVISFGNIRERRIVNTGLVARIVDNHIIIDHDANNKPLIDALLQAGIPREQIVLAYAGEKFKEAA
jgi:hypothetical protein